LFVFIEMEGIGGARQHGSHYIQYNGYRTDQEETTQ
jgi:hypothetical protein